MKFLRSKNYLVSTERYSISRISYKEAINLAESINKQTGEYTIISRYYHKGEPRTPWKSGAKSEIIKEYPHVDIATKDTT